MVDPIVHTFQKFDPVRIAVKKLFPQHVGDLFFDQDTMEGGEGQEGGLWRNKK